MEKSMTVIVTLAVCVRVPLGPVPDPVTVRV